MLQIPILLENQNFVAVNKPAGLSVHNEDAHGNLLSLLETQLKISKLFPVHRLDKETSGVQVLALNEIAAQKLSQQFQEREVLKIYRGILRGKLSTLVGVWKLPLTDKAEGRKNPQGIAQNRIPCETRYRVLQASNYFSDCEFQLITGRQHQIRKHAAISGNSLVGDPRYGDPKYNQKMAEIYKTDRMFLHCYQIEVLSNQILAPIPTEFTSVLEPVNIQTSRDFRR